MPLPLLIGGIAVVAGSAGVGSGIHGGIKMKKASNTIKEAKTIQEEALARFEENDCIDGFNWNDRVRDFIKF